MTCKDDHRSGASYLISRVLRWFSRMRFRILRLATIPDIPSDRLADIGGQLKLDGWRKTYEYNWFDAWIDYGCVKLKKDGVRIKIEWDPYFEGSIEGPRKTIYRLGEQFGLPVEEEWRWSRFDDN